MHTKDFSAHVKAAGTQDGLEEGQFTAIVSVFGNVDTYGDVVVPGAFTNDLKRWETSGDPLPVIWSHDWADPFSHIGHVTKAQETEQGLQVTGQLDLDNPKALQVYRLLKGRRVTQFSFAYDVIESGWSKHEGDEVYELRELKVFEVGPCLIGVNQETELLAVKATELVASAKAGRVLSQSNYDRLSAAHEAIGTVLAAATPQEDPKSTEPSGSVKTDEPSQADESIAADEEPTGAKSASTTASAPRRALAVAHITNMS